MTFFKYALPLLLVGYINYMPAWGFTHQEIEHHLNLLDETELAYSVALKVAMAENTYTGWKRVITEYPHQDQTHHHAYLNAWQAAVLQNSEAVYVDFMALRSDSSLNTWAIHEIYQLVKAQDTVNEYMRFIEQYPESVEALAAWQRIQALAFVKVVQQNKVSAYDDFVQAFLQAEHSDPQLLEQAMQAALAVEKKRIIAEFLNGETEPTQENWQMRERTARALYNKARHPDTSELAAMRNMQLLDSELFIDTKVVTEKFDREELIAHQQRLENKLDAVKQSVDDIHQGLLQGLREHSDALQQKTQRLEDVIADYDEWIHLQQTQLIAQTRLFRDEFSHKNSHAGLDNVVGEMLPPIPFVPPVLVKITTTAVIKSAQKMGKYLTK